MMLHCDDDDDGGPLLLQPLEVLTPIVLQPGFTGRPSLTVEALNKVGTAHGMGRMGRRAYGVAAHGVEGAGCGVWDEGLSGVSVFEWVEGLSGVWVWAGSRLRVQGEGGDERWGRGWSLPTTHPHHM